jgi:hypothetical protein
VTLAIAYITYQIVYKVLQKRFMLNGRKLFEIEILVGLVFQVLWIVIIRLFGTVNLDLTILYGIGFVLPGVIAHDMGRQGARKYDRLDLIGVSIVALIIFLSQQLRNCYPIFSSDLIPAASGATLRLYVSDPAPADRNYFSVFFDLLAYSKLQRVRRLCHGSLFGAFCSPPFDLIFVIVASILTFIFVQLLTARFVLAFGRTKLGMMILSG